MLNDLRYAIRLLSRAPGFTAVAAFTLALGIGGSVAVFSLFRGVFLSPLPFPEDQRLVSISERRGGSRNAELPVSGHEVMAWQQQNRVFDRMALFRPEALNLTGAGEPEMITVLYTSVDFFQTLGLPPALGRVFAPGEDGAGGPRLAILSDGFWRRRFAANPAIVGQTITLNDRVWSVIGVMPPLPKSLSVDAWVPLDVPDQVRAVGRHSLNAIARLKPGILVSEAQTDLQIISDRLARELPAQNTGHGAHVMLLRDSLVGEYRTGLLLLLSAVGFVLLIACANLANLLMTRGAGRQRELAVRAAIGAGQLRLIRQLLVESLILGILGGAGGLIIAAWVVDGLPGIVAAGIPLLDMARVDVQVAALAAALALVTGMLTGLVPAMRASRVEIGKCLAAGRGVSDDRRGRRLRALLVASQVAWTLMLLVGAGLMLNSFVRLLGVNPGFRTDNVLVVPIDLTGVKYQRAEQRRAFYDALLERLDAVGSVTAQGATSHLPLGGSDNWMPFTIAGRPPAAPGQDPNAAFRVVTPDYFRALDIPLRRGRFFTPADARLSVPVIRWFPQQPQPPGIDRPQAAPVALISETAARTFWPDDDPIGKRIRVLFSPEMTIVGVVGDVKHNALNQPASPHVYLPLSQEPWSSVSFVVRTSMPPRDLAAAVREQVRALDPNLPVTVRPMDDVRWATVTNQRFYLVLIGVFGVVALGLAVVGIFGVVSFGAAQRTAEIGVRLALGAQRREILTLIVFQATPPIALGVGAGLAGSLALSRFIETLLYEVKPADPLTFAIVAAVLAIVALAACWIPARRAARLDPVVALRSQ